MAFDGVYCYYPRRLSICPVAAIDSLQKGETRLFLNGPAPGYTYVPIITDPVIFFNAHHAATTYSHGEGVERAWLPRKVVSVNSLELSCFGHSPHLSIFCRHGEEIERPWAGLMLKLLAPKV